MEVSVDVFTRTLSVVLGILHSHILRELSLLPVEHRTQNNCQHIATAFLLG